MNFLNYKIIGASKKFKNQLRPLVRPGSVNFCPNFLNLSLSPFKGQCHNNFFIRFFSPNYSNPYPDEEVLLVLTFLGKLRVAIKGL
jgi:hypothetical protein